jgi:hypothetical protein
VEAVCKVYTHLTYVHHTQCMYVYIHYIARERRGALDKLKRRRGRSQSQLSRPFSISRQLSTAFLISFQVMLHLQQQRVRVCNRHGMTIGTSCVLHTGRFRALHLTLGCGKSVIEFAVKPSASFGLLNKWSTLLRPTNGALNLRACNPN